MAEKDPKYSRTSRRQGGKATKVNKALNISIGVVIFLIAVVAIIFITGDDDKKEVAIEKPDQSTQSDTAPIEPIVLEDQDEEDASEPEVTEPTETEEPEVEVPEEENTVVNEIEEPEAPVVEAPKVEEPKKEQPKQKEPKKEKPKKEHHDKKDTSSQSGEKSVVNPNWKPVGTKQTGEHVSKYDGNSTDWNEKKKAISYATGMSEDELYFDRIQNGGSTTTSEGIVRSKDNSKKYKVYLEWVDGEGWKPVKMDVLK